MRALPSNEIFRKILHLVSCVIPLSYLWFIQDKDTMVLFVGTLSIFAIFIEYLRNKFKFIDGYFKALFNTMLRQEESRGKITGATWMLFGDTITIFMFPKEIAVPALIFLSIGDTFAAIIGKLYPYIKIKDKTLTGTIAGIITSIIAGLYVNQVLLPEIIILGAIIAMVVELLPISVNDNLTIPVVSGSVMMIGKVLI